MGEASIPFISEPQFQFYELLAACMKDPNMGVRTSAFALLGDLAICTFSNLAPHLPQLMPMIISCIEPVQTSSYSTPNNNATWAAGEIALKYGNTKLIIESGIDQWITPLLARLIPALLNRQSQISLVENTAITLGRIGYASPQLVAPHLGLFARAFMDALGRIHDNPEKASALLGFCRLCAANPNAIMPFFEQFCDVSTRPNSNSDLESAFRHILDMFKSAMGEKWQAVKVAFTPMLQQRLTERYGI